MAINEQEQPILEQVKIDRLVREIEGYKEVIELHNQLVRELDILLNGEEGAAKQASLCDIVRQVRKEFIRSPNYHDQEPVSGDVLPKIGSKVLIHLNSVGTWVERTVAGYYAYKATGNCIRSGNERFFHRVYVRVVDDNGFENSRLLCDTKPV